MKYAKSSETFLRLVQLVRKDERFSQFIDRQAQLTPVARNNQLMAIAIKMTHRRKPEDLVDAILLLRNPKVFSRLIAVMAADRVKQKNRWWRMMGRSS